MPRLMAGDAQVIGEAVDSGGIAMFEDLAANDLAGAALRQALEPLDHHRRDADPMSMGEPAGENVGARHE